MWSALPDWLLGAVSAATGLLAALLGARLWAGVVQRLLRRWQALARALSRLSWPLGLWIGASVIAVLLNAAERSWLQGNDLSSLVLATVFIWLLLVLGDVVWSVVEKRRGDLRPEMTALLLLLHRAGKVLILAFGAAYLLGRLGLPLGNLVVMGGVVGAAVAFAARAPVENLFAFVGLTLDPPFIVGDEVRLVHFRGGPETSGRVQRVGLQSTIIQVKGRSLMSIPNGILTSSLRIENLSARDRRRLRLSLSLPEALTSSALERVCVNVEGELAELPMRDRRHPPRVWISGTSGKPRLEVEVWMKPEKRDLRREAEKAAVLAVKLEVERQGGDRGELAPH